MPTVAFDSEGLGPKEELVTSPLRLASLIRQLNGRNRTIVTIIAGGASTCRLAEMQRQAWWSTRPLITGSSISSAT